MRKEPLKRNVPLVNTTPIKRKIPLSRSEAKVKAQRATLRREASEKLRTYQREFKEMRPLVEARSNGTCEARIPGVCTLVAVHVHHRKLRKHGGTNLLVNLNHLCRACHQHIHNHPADAKWCGYIVSSWDDPALVEMIPWCEEPPRLDD